jgi:hypothetical protein
VSDDEPLNFAKVEPIEGDKISREVARDLGCKRIPIGSLGETIS